LTLDVPACIVNSPAGAGPDLLNRGITMRVFLNGEIIDAAEARIPVDDRGFLFADGVYEVVRVYDGRVFHMDPHMRRLRAGMAAIQIGASGIEKIPLAAERLLDENGLRSGDATIYVQVTRGVAPRTHAFPKPAVEPTIYVAAKPFKQHPSEYFERGVATITVPDTRWSRCDIKSIALLPNVLANQQAKQHGAFEALFVRDGVVIEGSHSNLFAVIDGELVTYPASNYILAGITRALVLELARSLDIRVREAAILLDELDAAEELFLSGTTTEVMPIATVDNRPVGDGAPGPITRRLREAFAQQIGARPLVV
jgi:D-alanine transaminase